MNQVFDNFPSVALLQILARGSLKQNLPKAVRLWVILRSLYGGSNDPVYLNLPEKFTYKQWRNQFFIIDNSKQHIDRDKIPSLHHKDCRCAIALADWLFNLELSPANMLHISEQEWKESFFQMYSLSENQLDTLLSSGSEGRLFGVTGKNIQQNHFQTLMELGWLEWSKNDEGDDAYAKVKDVPQLFINGFGKDYRLIPQTLTGFITQQHMTDILDDYLDPINNTQRFFVHLDYVVSKQNVETVEKHTEKLKTIWAKNPVPPLKISYQSASNWLEENPHIIYPICIYYFQRAAYLCAFGEKPKTKNIGWYNYRLDNLKKLEELDWNNPQIPSDLRQKYITNKLTSPEYIQQQMQEAWGFDFYRQPALMLLRFEPNFHEAYIQNSFRHHTFRRLNSTEQVKKIIDQSAKNLDQKAMLMKIVSDYPDDAYYKVNYRLDENNIIMRLRAWGPNVEVLLPLELRDRMARDLRQTWQLYQ